MREQTRTREQGTRVTNSKGNDAVKIAAIRAVVDEGQYAKVDGFMVDLFSASAIIQVYDALNETNKARYAACSVPRLADVAFRLAKRA